MSLPEPAAPSPHRAALKGRCPKCGEGRLYAGYLKLAPKCGSCGLDLTAYDQADGPAVFVMFIVGFLVVIPALAVELAYRPPYWIHAALWLPWTVAWALALLRPIKSWMVAQQFVHNAAEASFKE